MGFLSDDTDDTYSPAESLIDQQIAQDQAAIAKKNASLFQTRLDILKSNGRESWTPQQPSMGTPRAANLSPPTKGFHSLF